MSGQQRVGIAGVTHRQLVYFHGIPGSALELSLVADFQPPDTQVFAPDRCADSPDLDFQAYCDVLAARIIWMFPSDPIDLVGFSLGARLAIELGIRLGDRIGAVDLIAPAAPPECGVALADMAGGAVFRLARDAPRRFGVLAFAQGWLAKLAPALLARMLLATARGEDRALARDADFLHGMAANLRSGCAGHAIGYAREVRAHVVPWGARIAQLTAPVTLWHGDADNWAPIAMSAWLAGKLPNVRVFHRLTGKSHYSALIDALAAIG